MSLPKVINWPQNDVTEYDRALRRLLADLFAQVERDLSALQRSSSAAPTGDAADGTFVVNTARTELGAAGSKYLIFGWARVSGSWLEARVLTGN